MAIVPRPIKESVGNNCTNSIKRDLFPFLDLPPIAQIDPTWGVVLTGWRSATAI